MGELPRQARHGVDGFQISCRISALARAVPRDVTV
jgi:hypothetical protein